MSHKKRKLTDLDLERISLNEINKEEFSEHFEIEEQIEKLKESNEAILTKYTPEIMKRRILNKADQEGLFSRLLEIVNNKFVLASMATCCLLIFVLPSLTKSPNFRLKGSDATLSIYKKINDSSKRLSNLDLVKEGDVLQVSYLSRIHSYGLIFSIDGNGSTTLHFPSSNKSSNKLVINKEIILNNSFELDSSPDFEMFFFVSSKNSFDIKNVIEKAKEAFKTPVKTLKNGILPLDSSLTQHSIMLKKLNQKVETKE